MRIPDALQKGNCAMSKLLFAYKFPVLLATTNVSG